LERKYTFVEVEACEMCGAPASEHRMLGMRLNRSQGRRPRAVPGIAVAVMQCRRCDLIFPNPLPIPADISDHYDLRPEEYWHPDYFRVDPAYFAPEIGTAKRLLGFRPGMKALDIGAGLGKAMKALEAAGFDAYGIEPSSSFREAAVGRMGIAADRISPHPMEKAQFGREFEFITFGAVLEHLHHPSEAIERALSWLAPGGVIQIEVPSSSHLLARFLNLYFRLAGTNYVTHISPMHPPFHLYEFGLRSFLAHAGRAGYRIVEHEFHQNDVLFMPIPRLLHRPISSWMRRRKQGMQLTVWLGKGEAGLPGGGALA
jgi:2-polyprenyl-3-methyl-5-hydroxy-6-metoxy-1,4-benzoquinol methylase